LTETEQQKKEQKEEEKASIDPNLLPDEDREVYLKQLQQSNVVKTVDGQEISPYGDIPRQEQEPAANTTVVAGAFDLDIEQRREYARYAMRDTEHVEMRDGNVIKYKRQPIPEMEYEELEDLWTQHVSKRNLDDKPLSQIEVLHIQRLWLDKLGLYYWLNTKTKKMMTPTERRNAKDQAHVNKMLKSSFMRSNYDLGPIGKN